ncbi:MAG: hypothetical protein KDC66_18895 [Phaeodactylibacter sp.]|nr:hypothetical protein [Phaeodactylibacter sp.]MCB9273423.1 hypothetical protein [Lewinellaceae bacterium]
MKTSFKCLLAICLFLPAMAGASQPSSTLFNLLERNGVLKVELELSLSTLEENTKNENYYPATFRFTDNTGAAQEWDTRVRARGRYRRRVCDFPPLKIDFGKDDLQKKGLMPFDDLKLVTHCMDGDDGDDAALREYLGYVLYQKLTGYSLRAQLVEVAYKDTDGRRKITQYGILLEDVDELAARFDSEECEECYGLPLAQFDADNLRLNALFQYMIGNTDWSLAMNRNLKILKPKNGGPYWIAPYDFDFSGLVNAPYAVPNPDLKQQYIGQRIYMGAEQANSELESAAAYFQSKKQEILDAVEQFSLLRRRSRKEVLQYLNGFFDELDTGLVLNRDGLSGKPKSSGK